MAFLFSVHARERSACRGMDWIMKLKLKCKQIMNLINYRYHHEKGQISNLLKKYTSDTT